MVEQSQTLGVCFEIANKIRIGSLRSTDHFDHDLPSYRRLVRPVKQTNRTDAERFSQFIAGERAVSPIWEGWWYPIRLQGRKSGWRIPHQQLIDRNRILYANQIKAAQ